MGGLGWLIEKREYGWPEELSIEQIAKKDDPDDESKQKETIIALVNLCINGRLKYYGDIINGWSYREYEPNPYPRIEAISYFGWMDGRGVYLGFPKDCLIHRDDFKLYLQKEGKWPVRGPLANWWLDNDQQADNEISVDGEEIKGRLNKQVALIVKTAEELGYDDLLNIPIGGKTAIKTECMMKYPGLFTKDSFKTAWREANERTLIRIENKEKFKPNQ